MKTELERIFGRVSEDVEAHCGDMTENEPRRPAFVVEATRPEQVGELLKAASEHGVPVTPKVTGQNVGGLAIPAEGGIVLDLHRLTAIEIDADNMVAWIEPALAISMPFVAGTSVTIAVAVLMIAAGIARTIFAFQAESWGRGTLTFFLGVLTAFCGLVILARPGIGLSTLTLILAAYFFADGLFECIASFKLRPMKGWWWMLLGGFVSIALGLMIAREWPLSGLWAVGVLVGVKLIFAGWPMIMLGAAGRGLASAVDQVMKEPAREKAADPA